MRDVSVQSPLAKPPLRQAHRPLTAGAAPRLEPGISNIDRRAWADFWAAGKPGDRVHIDQAGGLCWLPDKAHLYGEPYPVDPLDAYLGVTASYRVPPRTAEFHKTLKAMKAAGLPMPPAAPVGRSMPNEREAWQ